MTPYIRAGILEHFRSTAEMLGGNADSLLQQADVSPEVMTIPGIYLPYANYMRLLDLAARATNSPHFGLAMTAAANAETLGTTGIIMTQADTVGAAWRSLVHYNAIHDTYGTVSLWQTDNQAVVSYAIPGNALPGARQIYDAGAGLASNIMKQFCGGSCRPNACALPYPEPDDLSCYDSLGTSSLRFNTDAMELYFDRALLSQPLPTRGDASTANAYHYLAIQDSGANNPASSQVETMIRRLLPTGRCTLSLVADTLSTSRRTLQARLESEHSSFRKLLEKVRREIATYHLRRGDLPLTQLAMILGYSELSAFSRSFRDWYGVSPRNWTAETVPGRSE